MQNGRQRYDQDVKAAISEAQRFIERAEFYLDKPGGFSAETRRAAMKRASMDLTRALVNVRKTLWSYSA